MANALTSHESETCMRHRDRKIPLRNAMRSKTPHMCRICRTPQPAIGYGERRAATASCHASVWRFPLRAAASPHSPQTRATFFWTLVAKLIFLFFKDNRHSQVKNPRIFVLECNLDTCEAPRQKAFFSDSRMSQTLSATVFRSV